MSIRTLCGLLLTAAALPFTAAESAASGLLIADGGFGGVLEIREHEVRVVINNGVAVTEVTQVFWNSENRIVEALYTFPVPRGASVSNFSMWIDGREMIGEVVEKKRAREIYESYKRTRVDPGLLEQVDYKSFEMRIFPIAPRSEQRVKITYYQELDFDHDWATYVYPLATVTRADIDQVVHGKFALTLDVKSEIPIAEMESPSHRDAFAIAKHGGKYAQASLETPGGTLERDVVLAFRTERPRTGFDLVASRQSQEDGTFLLSFVAGQELAEREVGMDYVFILDISGSMAKDGKLGISRASLGAFTESLGTEDRFELITFNTSPSTLFGALQPVDDENRDRARRFLESQKARGGTVLRLAMSTAYRYGDPDRILNVVVLSDGMTEQQGQRELLELIGQRPSGSRVFCIGVGNETNRPLLQQLADEAGGLAAFLSRGDDFQRQAQAFRRKLVRPAATDLEIAFDGGGVYGVEPPELPDLFHGAPLRIYGRYRKGEKVGVTVRGQLLGAPFEQSFELAFPEEEGANPEIERMWASHRVARLRRGVGDGSARPALVDEIVALCEEFSIVSEYASFIVLENDAEYKRWRIERRNARRIQRDRQARAALHSELARLRERTAANLGPLPEGRKETPRPDSTPSRRPDAGAPSTSFDVPVPGAGSNGGGAIDPLSGAIAIGLAAGAALAARRRRRREGDAR